jgi:hypothetical protein
MDDGGKINKEQINLASELSSKLSDIVSENKEFLETTEVIEKVLKQIIENEDQIKAAKEGTVDISQSLIDKNEKLLGSVQDLVDKENKRQLIQGQINGLLDGGVDAIFSMVGITGQLGVAIKALSGPLIVFALLAAAVQYLVDMVGKAVELKKEFGMSAQASAELEANLYRAKLNADGFLYTMEELRQATMDVVDETGRIRVSPETTTAVAKLQGLLTDKKIGVSLERTLRNAGMNASAVTDEIVNLAQTMGMDAGVAIDYISDNMLELLGSSESMVVARAREGLLLKKMGADMKELNRLASDGIDLEQTFRNEMKLRLMTGKNINLMEMEAAKATGQRSKIFAAQQKIVTNLGEDLATSNLKVQGILTSAAGVSQENALRILNAQREGMGMAANNFASPPQTNTEVSSLTKEIKGLTNAIRGENLTVVVDGKVVSRISRMQNMSNSVSTTGYGR